jgi:hypothetical protein
MNARNTIKKIGKQVATFANDGEPQAIENQTPITAFHRHFSGLSGEVVDFV